MLQNASDQKLALRRRIKERLARLSTQERRERSARACELLPRQKVWVNASAILFYAPMPKELDVWPLLEKALQLGKLAALPRYSRVSDSYVACQVLDPFAEVKAARFGIREPVDGCPEIELKRLDLILVPGVAFDLHGCRLGRGRGYYDRLLDSVGGKTCGIAFDEQIVSDVPVEAHDVLLNCILTPTRWYELA
jgi:5-formyltetrahydrofolate cyclo-ligase